MMVINSSNNFYNTILSHKCTIDYDYFNLKQDNICTKENHNKDKGCLTYDILGMISY